MFGRIYKSLHLINSWLIIFSIWAVYWWTPNFDTKKPRFFFNFGLLNYLGLYYFRILNLLKHFNFKIHGVLRSFIFYKYDDSNFNEFIVICEHCSEQLPFNWVSHNSNVNIYLLPYLAFNNTSHNYGLRITMEVLMVFMFMWIQVTNLSWLKRGCSILVCWVVS
jgi:uncharacterized CHY-type Zn-finger protein